MGSKPGGSPTPGQAELVKFPPPFTPQKATDLPPPGGFKGEHGAGLEHLLPQREQPGPRLSALGKGWEDRHLQPLLVLLLPRFLDVGHHNIDNSMFLTEEKVPPAETPSPLSRPLPHCSQRPGHCQAPSQSLVGTIQEG